MRIASLGLAVMLVLALAEPPLLAQLRGAGPRTTSSRNAATITGRVLIAGTQTPVRAAEVVAVSDSGRRAQARTDDEGTYRLERLAEGDWHVTASKAGYVDWEFGQLRPFEVPPPVTLGRGQRLTADIPLTRGGAISGRVFDQLGDPIAGLQVRVYRARMERDGRRLKAVGAADFTDDRGAFRVYGLPPGDYYVAASLRIAPIDSVVETTYSPTYFPGTGDIAEAQRVKLGLGSEATATFPLLPLLRARISGLVTNSAGSPADAFLNLLSVSSELGVPLGVGGVTRPDGTFTLTDVPPGQYTLTATLRGDGPDESGSVQVTVDGSEVVGASVVTGRPATLRGTIVAEAGTARRLPSGIEVVAISGRPGGSVLGSDSGTPFDITGLSEPFHLRVEGLSDEWVVKSIIINDANATDAAVELTPGSQGEARIVLTDQLTDVVGIVGAPEAAAGRTVVIFPQDTAKWGPRSRYLRVAQTGADGSFRVSGLPPNEQYMAIATDYLEEGEHLDPEFLNSMHEAAVPFSLEEGETRQIELRLIER